MTAESGSMRPAMVEPTWEEFRARARALLRNGLPPDRACWEEWERSEGQLDLIGSLPIRRGSPEARAVAASEELRVPRAFLEFGEAVSCHRNPLPWPLLYRILWRIAGGERNLLSDPADPDVAELGSMERAVRRDCHKMKAFVRFRSVTDEGGERFMAWFEPRHRIVRRTAPFFVRRFPSMRWSILTPDDCVHWDGLELSFSPGISCNPAADGDLTENAWLTYYRSTFNPARIRVSAMRAEMPIYYWKNLPEAATISPLLRAAPGRLREMIDRAGLDGAARLQARAERAKPHKTVNDHLVVRERTAALEPPSMQPTHLIPGIRIGVAGWDYPDWAGRVYPEGRRGVDRLRWLGSRFDLLEVNSTFYRPASPRVAESWLERTSDLSHLLFTAKIPQIFTHRQGEWRDSDVRAVREGMQPMLAAGRLRSLLVQFPWSFRNRDGERAMLHRVLDALGDFPLHVEVRHASWDDDGFRAELAARGVGIVNIDQPLFRDSLDGAAEVTNGIAYLRLHGRNTESWFREDASRDERYDYEYSAAELAPWVARAAELAGRDDVEEVEVVFNNHYRGQAVTNAEMFRGMLLL